MTVSTQRLWVNSLRFFVILYFSFASCEALALELDSTDLIIRITGQDTASHLGSQISCIGDINGDGFDDIGMFARIPRGFNIYYGGNPPDTSPDLILPGNAGRVTVIDVTGDGIDDIIIANVQNPTTNPIGTVYFFQGYGVKFPRFSGHRERIVLL